ncbi:ABC transporter permease [Streptomyces sp. PTY087I2]|uniref:ABC transporter permease n=1 Tax=Streptomyces sp. PTY087I2 TaxID=1819298 RepID=UPI00080B5A69|nr:ABC transporter permease [Streptomyces sp. PTY087I2]OCC14048.1 Dipeptide transport system permease protein DppB [Streptomyces sp. PTY087I2]
MKGREVVSRVLAALVTLLVLSVVRFFATELLPGDAVGVAAGNDATEAERAEIRERLGLDQPAMSRYLEWLTQLLRGDLGRSLSSGRAVGDMLSSRFGYSLVLILLAAAAVVVLAVVLGLAAGMRVDSRLDRLLSAGTVTLIAVPEFLLASALLMVLAQHWRLLPAVSMVPPGDAPWAHPDLLVLPVTSLVLGGLGVATRLVRAATAAVADSPAVEQARLDGESGWALAVWYVLPAAAGPAVQGMAVMVSGLLGGSLVVEALFNYPGVGAELARAVAYRDVPVVQGFGLALAAAVLVVLFLGDLLGRLLDVRSRPGTRRDPIAGGAP